jgi:hypothetical protein
MTTSFVHEKFSKHGIDENKNDNYHCDGNNRCSNKVDKGTMTNPLKIDLKMTSQFLDSLSFGPSIALPSACKFDESPNYSTYVPQGQDNSFPEEIYIKPQLIDGKLKI